jgi:TfoX/Sxy family transcriptional regulator of competence genes
MSVFAGTDPDDTASVHQSVDGHPVGPNIGERSPQARLLGHHGGVAYDEALAERVRAVLGEDPRLHEQKMFGGLAFMISGNMCVGIVGDDLMVRVGKDAYEDALAQPHAREMDFTGKPMRGIVYVDARGTVTDDALEAWVDRGLDFAGSLPRKR